MDISSLNLIKALNSVEAQTPFKENKVNETNNFKDYLNKSKNELKERNVDNNSKNKNENNITKDSKEDLKEVLNKIENILENNDSNLENKDFNIDNDDFLENITEVLMMLLNHISFLKNTSEEIPSFNLDSINEINIDDINKFITDNLTLKEEYIDKNKVISEIKDIKNSLNEILNNVNYDGNKDIKVNTNLVNAFEEVDSLNEALIKQVNELIKDVLDKDVFQNDKAIANENLDIVDLVNYLKSNFIKEDLKSDNKIVEKYENKSSTDLDNSKQENNDFKYEQKDMEVSKEEDFLSKILNDNTSNITPNNYYDRVFNNKLLSNTDVINSPVNINKETINTDIIKNIRYMLKGSIEELTVKIYPKELGELTIKILSEEGIMRAEIKATSKETYNLMNSNIHDIKKSLENQSIKIQEVNIGIYNEDTTFFSGREKQNENQRSFSENSNKAYISEEEVVDEIILDNNVNYLA